MDEQHLYAFPWPEAMQPGLTKREWYAGCALKGLLANHTWNEAALMLAGVTIDPAIVAARFAIGYADALLDELAKNPAKSAEPS